MTSTNSLMSKRFTEVQLHPLSYQALKKGHPWITTDKYTKRFPTGARFLIADSYVLLNDPQHPQIKARLWHAANSPKKEISFFWKNARKRLDAAIEKRVKQKISDQRQNIYLCFGEADQMPGLFIQQLGPNIIIQIFCFFWDKNFDRLKSILKESLHHFDIGPVKYFKQLRGNIDQSIIPLQRDSNSQFTVNEFGINYNIDLNSGSDFGLYTDMASIRSKIDPLIKESTSVLNLYAYTGAFSLQALKHCDTTSVDLSAKYLKWLDHNIELNQDIIHHQHCPMQMSAQAALKQLDRSDKRFDFIICDPPSFSSDGKKNTNSLENYKKIIPEMIKVLANEGKMLLCLNTHKIAPGKFYQIIFDILDKTKYEVVAKYKLSQDCPTSPYFKEGNYLKAILLKICK